MTKAMLVFWKFHDQLRRKLCHTLLGHGGQGDQGPLQRAVP